MSMPAKANTIRSEMPETSTNSVCSAAETTPAMRQYFEVKSRHADCLVFYRMGDFYELFFDDAVQASKILDIALTKRGKHNGADIQMCGVPVHAAEMYLPKLIATGLKIAICEQLETVEEAKKRGYKAVVKRDVVRIVTPGTITEETLLAAGESQFLAALSIPSSSARPHPEFSQGKIQTSPKGEVSPASSSAHNVGPSVTSPLGEVEKRLSRFSGEGVRNKIEAQVGFAWLDISTGAFTASAIEAVQLPAQLARLNPRELLVTQTTYETLSAEPWFNEWKNCCSIRPEVQFDAKQAERRIATHYNVSGSAVYGEFTALELAACGALLDYVQLTQLDASARLDPPQRELHDALLQMDAATRRNLELTCTLAGKRHGSLLASIDCTVSASGGRLLHTWLSAPLCEISAITARQDAVQWAIENTSARENWRSALKNIADMERAIGRLSLGRGGPRDLLALAGSLSQTNKLHEDMRNLDLPGLLADARNALTGHHALADQLTDALKPEVPHLARDGNFIADGHRADLDEYRRLRDESRRVIAAMETQLKTDTGIPSLKIKHNNVLGYFIEITPIHEKKIPDYFVHRQGLAGALRYSTPVLAETALKIDQAADKALKMELALFEELVQTALAQGDAIIAAARALAVVDVIASLAELAAREQWVRPELRAEPVFNIKEGRHPVVEAALRRQHAEFIANDCVMGGAFPPNSPLEGGASAERTSHQNSPKGILAPPQGGSYSGSPMLHLITGPNMGGKSTFLRQQAVLVILAQLGSFVPAKAATIGLVDRLFCRVGAADDLARGQSTFMVEMVETASILHQATGRSLVVLDEIGRGTATYDGVSIAWAVAEHLHNVTECRALFATHYHELTELAESLPRLANFHASAREYNGQLVFLHRIAAGAADKSYGIHVAALAGMPHPVLARAKQLLTTLESGHSLTEKAVATELPLFAVANAASSPASASIAPTYAINPAHEALAKHIASLDVDGLTPRQALDILAELKSNVNK